MPYLAMLRPLLTALVLVGATAAYPSTPRKDVPLLTVGDPAPPLRVSRWLKGEPVLRLGDGKIHVLEFWATWCGPCIGAMPHVSSLARKHAGFSKASFVTRKRVWWPSC